MSQEAELVQENAEEHGVLYRVPFEQACPVCGSLTQGPRQPFV